MSTDKMSTLQQKKMGLHCHLQKKRKFEENYSRVVSQDWTKKFFYEVEDRKHMNDLVPDHELFSDSSMSNNNLLNNQTRSTVLTPLSCGNKFEKNNQCQECNRASVNPEGSKVDSHCFTVIEKQISLANNFAAQKYSESTLDSFKTSSSSELTWYNNYEHDSSPEEKKNYYEFCPTRTITPGYINYGGNNHFVEGGKSYLEIGSYSYTNQFHPIPNYSHTIFRHPVITSKYCGRLCSNKVNTFYSCDKTGRWGCQSNQRRLVINISMCKLSLFKQFAEPSLHKSVLICNTLRLLERDIQNDPRVNRNFHGNIHNFRHNQISSFTTAQCASDALEKVSIRPVIQQGSFEMEGHLPTSDVKQYTELTPLCINEYSDAESTEGESKENAINWCRVLGLSNQSELDSTSHNAYDICHESSLLTSEENLYYDSDFRTNYESWKISPLLPLKPEEVKALHLSDAIS